MGVNEEKEAKALGSIINGLLADVEVEPLDQVSLFEIIEDTRHSLGDVELSTRSASMGDNLDLAFAAFEVAKFVIDVAVVGIHAKEISDWIKNHMPEADWSTMPTALKQKLADDIEHKLAKLSHQPARISKGVRDLIGKIITLLRT